jgi:hypothetical protein
MFRSETSKGPAGLREEDGSEEDVRAVKLSDRRSGKRWMEE